jgi:hypothetical protein
MENNYYCSKNGKTIITFFCGPDGLHFVQIYMPDMLASVFSRVFEHCSIIGTCMGCKEIVEGNLTISVVEIKGQRGIAIGIENKATHGFHFLAAMPLIQIVELLKKQYGDDVIRFVE